jgi:8-oxo-dGTP diphosphatase
VRREYPIQPIVGVGALILRDGKLVVVRRGVQPGRGKWSIPGGAVELGEKTMDAAVREAKEESGLDIELEACRPLDVIDSIIKDDKGRLQFHYVLLQFLARSKGGTLKPSGDVLDVQWVSVEDLKELDLTDSFRLFLQRHRGELERF